MQPYNTQALEDYIHLYQSIEYFDHKVFKNQGQVPIARLTFWLNHYREGGKKVITSTEYLGDRINENLTRYQT